MPLCGFFSFKERSFERFCTNSGELLLLLLLLLLPLLSWKNGVNALNMACEHGHRSVNALNMVSVNRGTGWSL